MSDQQTVYCICESDGGTCFIKESGKRSFTKFDDFKGRMSDANIMQATEDKSRTSANGSKCWKWGEKQCELFYVLLFDNRGHRIRNREIMALPNTTSEEFPDAVETVLVLSLFEKSEPDHEFLTIRKANGIEFDLVIDLRSEVEQTQRAERRCAIYFGFLSPSYSKLAITERVALKRESITSDDSEKVKKIREEIAMAMKAGGQYNMKYLAHTNIENDTKEVWIAMELCCMETLDDLIFMKESDSYVIGRIRMKILFQHILRGLSHLHMRGIAHGEMIMENILLSLDHKCLKIGDYDHVKQNQTQGLERTPELDQEFKNDMDMTASMFYMCLTRAKHNAKKLTTDIPQDCEDWLSSLLTKSEDTVIITKTIFPNLDPKSIEKHISDLKIGLSDANWPLLLSELSKRMVRSTKKKESPDPYLSAYLIIHMVLDKPKPEDVLKHPFFWDEFKILCFISRADAFFNNEKQHNLENDASQIRSAVQKDCEYLWPKFQWLTELKHSLEEKNRKEKNEKAKSNIVSKATEVLKHHGPSDFTGLLRVIRNVHNHYHEPDKKDRWFHSSSEVWNHFNENMYPGMVCLLHRAVWKKRYSEELPDDLRRFFKRSDNALNLPDFTNVTIE